MDFVKINKERHAVKTFDGKKIPTVDVKQIISAASLAPSAHNIQPWHFVIVESEQKRQELLSVVHGKNGQQVKEAGAVIAIFSDTNLSERSSEIARTGAGEMDSEQLQRFNSRYPQMFENMDEMMEASYLSLNIGFVTMNLMYVIKNRGYEGNIILGFERTERVNEILEVDKRYRPELLVVLGSSEVKGQSSYRLPQQNIIEIR
ncbi:nitroreductase family protein [Lactococcus garvieae]|nr:nitroreductase family protein [Lactococcus garvieae]CEF51246.1 Putative NAD(P)H nitroreductase [Lactococcus garvieae]